MNITNVNILISIIIRNEIKQFHIYNYIIY